MELHMDRPNVVTRISRLKSEIERLRLLATDCHPAVSTEITSLADDMNSHVSVLENFLASATDRAGHERL
jgi:hypothetical protein